MAPTPFDWADDALKKLAGQGLLRSRRTVVPLEGGRCLLMDSRNEPLAELWNFATNDYLGLAGHAAVQDAAIEAIRRCGTGARASALVSGRTEDHALLERRLAELKKKEAALLFPTGFAANVGTIAALVGPDDVVLCDRLNHASLVDGCRMSRARLRVYPHCDVAVVERELTRAGNDKRKLIVTDSLFSMDGDAAPLADLIFLAEQHNAMLLVDEAHALGVFGLNGSGLLEDLPASPNVIVIGTLSKALGAQGGFAAGSRKIIDWIWNTARTQLFSTALTPAACAAALSGLSLIRSNSTNRSELLQRSQELATSLRQMGWTVPDTVCGPIIPVIIGESTKAVDLSQRLQQLGCLVPAIRPPTVPHGTSRLRISLSVSHGADGVAALLEAFRQLDR